MKRRAADVLSKFTIERSARLPLHQQLYRALRDAIRRGQLPTGSRLPSSRALADRIGVSRNTVLSAYDELVADGLVEGRIGAGTRIAATHVKSRDVRLTDPDGNPIQVRE